MKILAISKETKRVDWEKEEATLKKEAAVVYRNYLSGKLREVYFTEKSDAVLILECKDLREAKRVVNRLPLVKRKIIAFEFMELNPYTGISRIIIQNK